MLVVISLIGTVLAISLGGLTAALNSVRGDASVNVLLWQFKIARETAVNERRNVEVRLTPPNFISVVRRNIPNGETVISTAVLQHQSSFRLFPGLPDTPDLFGNPTPIAFGAAAAFMFTPDGRFTDQAGAIVNGSVFIGQPSAVMTARALTVFGPTAGLRTFQWNGAAWVH